MAIGVNGTTVGKADNLGGGMSSGEGCFSYCCGGGGYGYGVLIGIQGGVRRLGGGGGVVEIGGPWLGGVVRLGLVLGETPPLLVVLNRRRSSDGPF